MRIRYIGKRKIRIVGPCEWNEANGYLCEVEDPELVEDLLTEPSNEFEEAGDYQPPKKKKNWNKDE